MANDETYLDEQREEVRARLQRFQDQQKAINDQIRILKGRYSNQIYQIKESIMKFLDKETGTLGERIRTLFKEQGITIVSILTAVGMAIGVLIEALLGGPTGLAEPVRPLRPWSDQKYCYLWSKPCNFSVLVGPIIVRSRFFSNGRSNLELLPLSLS